MTTAVTLPCLCGHQCAAHHPATTQCGYCLCEEYRPDNDLYPIGQCVTS